MGNPVLITQSDDVLISADDMRDYIRADSTDEDITIDALTRAATQYLGGSNGVLNRALSGDTWREDFSSFPTATYSALEISGVLLGVVRLTVYPVASISSVKYVDEDGVLQTLATDQYELIIDALGACVVPTSGFDGWPGLATRSNAVQVTYVAGYASPADVPEADKQIIRALVAHWFENREISSIGHISPELPFSVDELIRNRRRIVIA